MIPTPARLLGRSLLSTLAALLLAVSAAAAAETAKPADAGKAVIRINAGAAAESKDAEGNTWLADQGFAGGDVIERDADMKIANTKTPSIYHTEHYGMDSFSYKLPNGKYTVKLHFAETFEGVDGAGQRVFSFKIGGHEFKDFDVFVKAGGVQRAYVETVPVEITDGKLDITFTSKVENPEINGIEIIPAS
jgi:alcohol dehydrogenase (cytochrome c)